MLVCVSVCLSMQRKRERAIEREREREREINRDRDIGVLKDGGDVEEAGMNGRDRSAPEYGAISRCPQLVLDL